MRRVFFAPSAFEAGNDFSHSFSALLAIMRNQYFRKICILCMINLPSDICALCVIEFFFAINFCVICRNMKEIFKSSIDLKMLQMLDVLYIYAIITYALSDDFLIFFARSLHFPHFFFVVHVDIIIARNVRRGVKKCRSMLLSEYYKNTLFIIAMKIKACRRTYTHVMIM